MKKISSKFSVYFTCSAEVDLEQATSLLGKLTEYAAAVQLPKQTFNGARGSTKGGPIRNYFSNIGTTGALSLTFSDDIENQVAAGIDFASAAAEFNVAVVKLEGDKVLEAYLFGKCQFDAVEFSPLDRNAVGATINSEMIAGQGGSSSGGRSLPFQLPSFQRRTLTLTPTYTQYYRGSPLNTTLTELLGAI